MKPKVKSAILEFYLAYERWGAVLVCCGRKLTIPEAIIGGVLLAYVTQNEDLYRQSGTFRANANEETISFITRRSKATVRRHLKSLCAKGVIELVERVDRDSVTYDFNWRWYEQQERWLAGQVALVELAAWQS